MHGQEDKIYDCSQCPQKFFFQTELQVSALAHCTHTPGALQGPHWHSGSWGESMMVGSCTQPHPNQKSNRPSGLVLVGLEPVLALLAGWWGSGLLALLGQHSEQSRTEAAEPGTRVRGF